MKRVVLLAVGVLAVWTPTAQAHTTIIEPPNAAFPYQRWVDEAKVPTPPVTIEVIETTSLAECGGATACTDAKTGEILIDAPANRGVFPRRTILHEVGHNVDHAMPPWMHNQFERLLGIEGESWRSGPPQSPGELFAESWAQCALRPVAPLDERHHLGLGLFWQARAIGGPPVHNAVCRMLEKLPG